MVLLIHPIRLPQGRSHSQCLHTGLLKQIGFGLDYKQALLGKHICCDPQGACYSAHTNKTVPVGSISFIHTFSSSFPLPSEGSKYLLNTRKILGFSHIWSRERRVPIFHFLLHLPSLCWDILLPASHLTICLLPGFSFPI